MKATEASIELDPSEVPGDPVISGTMLPALIGQSPFSSPAQAVMEICGLWSPSENEAMVLGRTMETPLIAEIEKREHRTIAQPPPIQDDYGRWQYHLRHGLWGAHIDGITDRGMTIVEVKTASSTARWMDLAGNVTIPYNYYLQGSLYAWLAQADTIEYIVGIVPKCAYAHPDAIPKHETVTYRVQPMYLSDPDAWREAQEKAVTVLKTCLNSRTISLNPQDPRDASLYRDLMRHESADRTVPDLLTQLEAYDARLAAVQDLRDEVAGQIKAKLVEETAEGADTLVTSSSGTQWVYRRQRRTRTDYKTACADAKLALTDYMTSTVVEVLEKKKIKQTEKNDKKEE